MFSIRQWLFLFIICVTTSCSNTKRIVSSSIATDITSVKFLGQYTLPHNLSYKSTVVGGLSGIDYDVINNRYYLISDDRSAINPARFYTANIFLTQHGIDSIQLAGVEYLLQSNGVVYPNNKQDKYHAPDPEAIRYKAQNDRLIWSSEGERIVKADGIVLENPAITIISSKGRYIDTFPLPHNLIMQSTEKGPRQNGVLEGLTYADNYKTLYVSVEEPLYEDGPRADVTDNNAYIRILKYDVADRKNTQQFAYKLDPVAYPANPVNEFKVNGVPDILSIGDNKLLVIERSFSTGRLPCTIKLFIADLKNATDIMDNPSLKNNNNFIPAEKKLLLNMDALGIYTDNIEGVTFGPLLPNGHRTLLFVADNNFNFLEKTQFLLFELTE
ncbi:esterase-like activity of phytase family protein [Ferruginibacter lapsinanis]|uniref:esterase-like activity of phytase family protein n=1 Tax=Ferruginibacter lapsinanis TaxID=563172 RepID=UPI001E356BDD|nr:esterase-like activity of phytase family protein [Ferruginibacter lapsinanis]UEG51227.1 esterase-like activity of phytase family protein [Ferruginibacter lapsinanis]